MERHQELARERALQHFAEDMAPETKRVFSSAEILDMVGIETVTEEVAQALERIFHDVEFAKGEFRAVEIMNMMQEHHPDLLQPEEWDWARQATPLTDIGKYGGPMMSMDKKELVFKMYEVKGVENGNSLTVKEFFAKYMAEDDATPEQNTILFDELVAESKFANKPADKMTMQEFWSGLHTKLTAGYLEDPQSALPSECIPGAVCHHIMEGVNPRDIEKPGSEFIQPGGKFVRAYGSRDRYGAPELLVALIDQYDAFTSRTLGDRKPLDHRQALEVLAIKVNKAFGEGGKATKILANNPDNKEAHQEEHIMALRKLALELISNIPEQA